MSKRTEIAIIGAGVPLFKSMSVAKLDLDLVQLELNDQTVVDRFESVPTTLIKPYGLESDLNATSTEPIRVSKHKNGKQSGGNKKKNKQSRKSRKANRK